MNLCYNNRPTRARSTVGGLLVHVHVDHVTRHLVTLHEMNRAYDWILGLDLKFRVGLFHALALESAILIYMYIS